MQLGQGIELFLSIATIADRLCGASKVIILARYYDHKILIRDPIIEKEMLARANSNLSSVDLEYVLYPKSEVDNRIKRLQSQMDDMDGALLFHSVDLCYFTGTAQDGLAYIPRDG